MDGDERRSSFSVLQGDGLYFSRILSRKSSVGQSSRIYYRPAEGVPFKWEMQPGTPKNQSEEESIPFPPLSPPPQLQNKLLPSPMPSCLDQPKNHTKFFWFLKRIKITELYEKAQLLSRASCTGKELPGLSFPLSTDQFDGDFISSLINHSRSSSRNHVTGESSSLSSSSSSSSIRRESPDGPFCCSPWNVTAIMEEGNRKVYYCRDHKTAFAMENDGSFLSKIILSRVSSSVDRSSFRFYNHRASGSGEGIPFHWELQPGRPKDHHPPELEEEMIPPPSPPPALQSLVVAPLPRPRAHDSVKPIKTSTKTRPRIFWNWIKTKKMQKTTLPASVSSRFGLGEISFKLDDDHREEESLSSGRDSVSRSSSSSISILRLNSKEQLKLSIPARDLFYGHSCFNFKPWN